MGQNTGERLRSSVAAALLAAVVLSADLYSPPGLAIAVAYCAVVAVASRRNGSSLAVPAGVAATAIALTGSFLSPFRSISSIEFANLAIALAAIWGTVSIMKKDSRYSGTTDRNKVASQLGQALDPQGSVATLPENDRLAGAIRLTGTVAHELRNPLAVIATSIAVLELNSGSSGPKNEAALERAKRAVGRCEAIITEHLDLARATGHHPEPVNLDDWLDSLLDDLSIPDGVVLKRKFECAGVVTPVDKGSLRRALVNLIDNACQAMAESEDLSAPKILTLSSRETGEAVEISVADNGPGIPAELLGRLPEPLFSTKPSGTGLGLATAHRIMHAHGGDFRIESEPGRGTQVTLQLPRNDNG